MISGGFGLYWRTDEVDRESEDKLEDDDEDSILSKIEPRLLVFVFLQLLV